MRIGIDIRCLAEGRRTGVEEYTQGLLEALFAADRRNEYVLFFNSWSAPKADFSWAEKYPNVTVRVFRIPNKLLNFSLWYLRSPKLDRLLRGVDLFFMPNQNFVALSRAARLVVTAHDLSFELTPETFTWKQRLWHYLVNFRKLSRAADRVIAVSRSTARDLETLYGLPADRVAVVYSGRDLSCRQVDRNDLSLMAVKDRYRLPYRFILSFGTFEPRKNTEAVLAAFEALRGQGGPAADCHLVLAGSPGWSSQALEARIRRSPERDRIRVIGFVAQEDKAALYTLASVLVYPSFYEGFGFPPLEAMASGLPVITSHASSLPEITGDAALLIDPYQPNEILLAFQSVLGSRELSDALRARGLERAAKFSWSRAAGETLRVFQALEKR